VYFLLHRSEKAVSLCFLRKKQTLHNTVFTRQLAPKVSYAASGKKDGRKSTKENNNL